MRKLQYLITFIIFVMANRKIVTFGGYFEAFIAELPSDVVQKIDYGLALLRTMDRLPAKHMKYVEDGIVELRTEYEGIISGLSSFLMGTRL